MAGPTTWPPQRNIVNPFPPAPLSVRVSFGALKLMLKMPVPEIPTGKVTLVGPTPKFKIAGAPVAPIVRVEPGTVLAKSAAVALSVPPMMPVDPV